MTDAVAIRAATDLGRYLDDNRALIRRTYAEKLDDNEFELFSEVCRARRLNPVAGHITAFKISGRVSFSPTIQGSRLIAARTGEYAGCDDVVFTGQGVTQSVKHPTKATATVYRMIQGVRCPFTASVDWSERCPRDADRFQYSTWAYQPKGMLAKCAEKLALSKAFPEEFADLDPEQNDEADDYDDAPRPVARVREPAVMPRPDPDTVQMRERLTDEWQEGFANAAAERQVGGIHPPDPEQTPGTQQWSQIVEAIIAHYRRKHLMLPNLRIGTDGRLNPGEIMKALLDLPAVVVEAEEEGDA